MAGETTRPARVDGTAMRLTRILMFTLAVAVAAGLLGGCSRETSATTGQPIDLGATEVREYQGKRLDSVGDFRENSIKGPQDVPLDTYRLKVFGEVDTPLELTYDEVIARQQYKKVVTLNCVEGWSVDILWEGVRLADLLEQAGYDPNAKTVIFRCYDGYSTSLPLKKVVGQNLLFAYKMNGIDLPKERGFPFQVVAEDQWGYKWAKWVTEIEVSNSEDFRGYWESRGYDNDATLPEAKRRSESTTTP